MKKFVSILLACLMMCTAVLGLAESMDVTGEWYLNTIIMDEMQFSAADFGMNMTLTINADGTLTLDAGMEGEEPEQGTWAADGDAFAVTITGDTVPASITDGLLSMAADEETLMVFSREMPVGFVAAAPVAVEDIAAFNGTWSATMVNAFGMVVPIDAVLEEMDTMIGMTDVNIVIENGVVSLFGAEETQEFPLVDGALFIAGTDEDGVLDQKIELLEDGTIAYTVMTIIFYCSPVAAE